MDAGDPMDGGAAVVTEACRCAATSKRSGERCRRPVAPGRAVCAMHGGKSLSGVAHPNYRSGRYQAVLPVRLQQRFEQALGDPDLLSMTPELAALDARISELVARLSSGESGAAWARLRRAWDDYREARAIQDQELMDDALERLEDALERGTADEAAWDAVYRAWNQRQRFVASEVRRMVDAQLYVGVGQFAQVLSVLADSLQRNVRDRGERNGVVSDMRRMLGRGGSDHLHLVDDPREEESDAV